MNTEKVCDKKSRKLNNCRKLSRKLNNCVVMYLSILEISD